MSAVPSTVAFLRRRGLLTGLFALAACDIDTTPIVQDKATDGGERLQLAPTNTSNGGAAA